MIEPPRLVTLGEIAHNYDALLCDVWGVVHKPGEWRLQKLLKRYNGSVLNAVLLS